MENPAGEQVRFIAICSSSLWYVCCQVCNTTGIDHVNLLIMLYKDHSDLVELGQSGFRRKRHREKSLVLFLIIVAVFLCGEVLGIFCCCLFALFFSLFFVELLFRGCLMSNKNSEDKSEHKYMLHKSHLH